MPNIVAIVGRPNVGKSTLFNRLLQQREAIVDSTAGVTRDRHYGKSEWNGVEFSVIDTGGFTLRSDDIFEEEIREQIDLALNEAEVVLFLVDAKDGLTDLDKEFAEHLRKSPKKVFLVVNKVDSHHLQESILEFYELGYSPIYPISAISGAGTGELLDEVVKNFNSHEYKDPFEGLPKVTIAGRPNVGKSTLTNALLGEKRTIVTDIAGTTRDAIETLYDKFGHKFVLVDTAGMRKKSKVHEDLEFYSVMRSIRAIEFSDVVILMIDATQGWESQDMNIFHLAEKNRKGIVIVVNKWDLVEKDHQTLKIFESNLRKQIAPFTDVPIIFVSAITKQRIFKVVETAMQVYQNRSQRIKTSRLNEDVLPIFEQFPPPAIKGKHIKIKYCTQLPTKTPQFVFFCNLPQYIKENYKRFVENQLRKIYPLTGVPIEIYFRKK